MTKKRLNFKGEKYTLHIISYDDIIFKVRWSDNKITETVGCVLLEKDELTIDQLVELIKNA